MDELMRMMIIVRGVTDYQHTHIRWSDWYRECFTALVSVHTSSDCPCSLCSQRRAIKTPCPVQKTARTSVVHLFQQSLSGVQTTPKGTDKGARHSTELAAYGVSTRQRGWCSFGTPTLYTQELVGIVTQWDAIFPRTIAWAVQCHTATNAGHCF